MENWAEKKKNEFQQLQLIENQFQRLPDDVVVNILDKVSEIKWLCRFFVVSKRLSSLIPLLETVSVKMNARDFLSIPRDFNKFAGLPSSSSWNVRGPEFFAKLTQIRSLNLDLVSDFGAGNDSVFKWGAKFTSDHLDSLTFLFAESLEEITETENEVTPEKQIRPMILANECAKEARLWLRILSRVIVQHTMLESITITDSMNKGVRLCLGGEKLVECRNAFVNAVKCPEEALPSGTTQENIWVGSGPVLQLPMSGYVMKGVTIIHFKRIKAESDYSESEAQLAMVDAFAEEQGLFSEAVVQILKNYEVLENQIRGFMFLN